jgi:acetoin utilization deacetylase AcuC-like enzyme
MDQMNQTKLAIFYPDGHADHAMPGHPERPERVEAIRSALVATGFWAEAVQVSADRSLSGTLASIHDPAYLSLLERAARRGGGWLDQDTYITPQSWNLAVQAACGTLSLVQSVWSGQYRDSTKIRRGFALARPPGHHAKSGQGMGFCLLNNIAIAAQYIIQQENAKRLAIVDLDLHHGNGTQEIFWERSDVLYISTHQSPLYPGSGSVAEIGGGAGEGWTLNLPLPPGSGDEAFEACMHEMILPILLRAQPEMILVSYGFDPHWRDPLGSLRLSASGYGRLIADLVSFADAHCHGRIAIVLEGGYDLTAAGACSQAVCAALLGIPFSDPIGPSPEHESEHVREKWRRILDQARAIAQL